MQAWEFWVEFRQTYPEGLHSLENSLKWSHFHFKQFLYYGPQTDATGCSGEKYYPTNAVVECGTSTDLKSYLPSTQRCPSQPGHPPPVCWMTSCLLLPLAAPASDAGEGLARWPSDPLTGPLFFGLTSESAFPYHQLLPVQKEYFCCLEQISKSGSKKRSLRKWKPKDFSINVEFLEYWYLKYG
jgi:hypothetical protein